MKWFGWFRRREYRGVGARPCRPLPPPPEVPRPTHQESGTKEDPIIIGYGEGLPFTYQCPECRRFFIEPVDECELREWLNDVVMCEECMDRVTDEESARAWAAATGRTVKP